MAQVRIHGPYLRTQSVIYFSFVAEFSLNEVGDLTCKITDYLQSQLLVVFLKKAQKMPQDAEEHLMRDFIAVWKSVQDPFIKNIRFKK